MKKTRGDHRAELGGALITIGILIAAIYAVTAIVHWIAP